MKGAAWSESGLLPTPSRPSSLTCNRDAKPSCRVPGLGVSVVDAAPGPGCSPAHWLRRPRTKPQATSTKAIPAVALPDGSRTAAVSVPALPPRRDSRLWKAGHFCIPRLLLQGEQGEVRSAHFSAPGTSGTQAPAATRAPRPFRERAAPPRCRTHRSRVLAREVVN